MPLRFIVRATLQEQLNTRHMIMAAACASSATPVEDRHRCGSETSVMLGSLPQQNTAARQNCRLRAAMDSTSSRIESLEKELNAMKKFISKESEQNRRNVMDFAQSASFHCFHQPSNVSKTLRGEKGSISNLSTILRRREVFPPQPQAQKSLGKRLNKGMKNAFPSSSKEGIKKNAVNEIYEGLEDFVWIKDNDDDKITEELHSQYIKTK